MYLGCIGRREKKTVYRPDESSAVESGGCEILRPFFLINFSLSLSLSLDLRLSFPRLPGGRGRAHGRYRSSESVDVAAHVYGQVVAFFGTHSHSSAGGKTGYSAFRQSHKGREYKKKETNNNCSGTCIIIIVIDIIVNNNNVINLPVDDNAMYTRAQGQQPYIFFHYCCTHITRRRIIRGTYVATWCFPFD